ncbi:MAG: carboxypeptidase-like regulatory domain-containing protein, partial [Planctomycetota bacterium]
ITEGDGQFAAHYQRAGLLKCLAAAPDHIPTAGPWLQADGTNDLYAGTLVLDPGGLPIAGRVVDASGTGIPEIELRLEAEAADEAWARREEAWEDISSETETGGRIAFSGLREGLYRVRAEIAVAGEWTSITTEHIEAGTQDLEIVVSRSPREAEFHVCLTVALPDGSPLPAGGLHLRSDNSGTWLAIHDGKVEGALEGIPPFAFLVWHPASSAGNSLPYRPVFVEGLPPGRYERSIVLVPGERMRGCVVTGGAPLPDVKVTARPLATYRRNLLREPERRKGPVFDSRLPHAASFEGRTNEGGRFALVGLFKGPYVVQAQLAGYRPVRRFVAAEAGDENVIVEMVPAVRQEVRVQAPIDAILGGGHLMLWELTRTGPSYVTSLTTSVGRRSRSRFFTVTLGDLKPGATYRLHVRPSHAFAPATTEFVAGGETVVVRLARGESLAGRVIREDGSPVAGATIQAAPALPPWTERHVLEGAALVQPKTNTDLAGQFRLTGLIDDVVQVQASAPGLVLAAGPRRLTPGSDPVELILVPAAGISGRIVPAQPPDLRVEYWRATSTGPELLDWNLAGADGFFRKKSLPPGAYTIVVWNVTHDDDDRYVVTEPIAAGTHRLRLPLVSGGRIVGTMMDHAGRPLGGVAVRLEQKTWNRHTRTDARGRFVLRGLPLGRYWIRAILSKGPDDAIEATTGDQVEIRIRTR